MSPFPNQNTNVDFYSKPIFNKILKPEMVENILYEFRS